MNTTKKRYGYVVWSIATCIYIIVFFHRVALGVAKDDLMVAFGLRGTSEEGSLFALLSSMYMYAYMLMQIPTGILADTLGPRRTITLGSIVAAAGAICFAQSQQLWLAMVSRFVVGLGVAVVFVCILKLIADWFPKEKFGTMSGITSFIGNMGAILAMTPLLVLNEWVGWRNALMGVAVVHIILAVLAFVLIKEKKKPEVENGEEEAPKVSLKKGIVQILKDRGLYPIMLAYGVIFGSTMALTGTWGVTMIHEVYGASKNTGATLMSLITLGVAVGSICIGKLSDHMNSRTKPMRLFAGLHLACWCLLILMPPISVLYPLFFVLGFTGTSFIVSWAYAKERHSKEYSGTAMSVVNFAGFLGGALMPQVVGLVYDQMAAYDAIIVWRTALLVISGLVLIAFACFMVTKEN